jgi:O-antigen/teichoic acid export membrane protein
MRLHSGKPLPAPLQTSILRRNVLANYSATAWLGAVTLVSTPLYLRWLDHAQWGLIAACVTVQSMLVLLDIGMTQSMPRAFARVARDPATLDRAFRAHARLYVGLASIVFVVGQVVAPFIARGWLARRGVDPEQGEWALRLLLVQFLFQFSNNAHVGFWLGTERQVQASVRQCVFMTLRHGSALAVIGSGHPSAIAYLAPFAFWAAVECLANRHSVMRTLSPTRAGAGPSLDELGAVLRSASVLTLAVAVGMVVSQADRLLLSTVLSIDEFGRYAASAALGLAFLQLQYPLVRAFRPRMVAVQAGDPAAATALLRPMAVALLVGCIVPCALAAAFAGPLLHAWTGDATAAVDGRVVLQAILVAVALNGAYSVVYPLMLASGSDRTVLAINLVSLAAVGGFAAAAGSTATAATGGEIWLLSASVQCIGGATWLACRLHGARDRSRLKAGQA